MRYFEIPDLNELAFERRNKEYGAYHLRKRYFRFLLISTIIGIIIAGFISLIPLVYYYFEPVPLLDDDYLFEAEYTVFNDEHDWPEKMAYAAAKLPEEPKLQQPVVTDSVPPEKEKPKEEPPEVKPDEHPVHVDSSGQKSGSGLGQGTGDDGSVMVTADIHPQFPGGNDARLKFLRQNVRYPEEAVKKQIQGVVMTSFIVERDGTLSNIKIISGIGGGCDEEAIRVINTMPRWEPAKRNGKPVRIILKMPILFRIPGTGRS